MDNASSYNVYVSSFRSVSKERNGCHKLVVLLTKLKTGRNNGVVQLGRDAQEPFRSLGPRFSKRFYSRWLRFFFKQLNNSYHRSLVSSHHDDEYSRTMQQNRKYLIRSD